MRYFVSYTGFGNKVKERRVYGFGIVDMTNELKTEKNFKELKKHLEKKDNLFDVVILNFKEIK
jgi:hypothetical protein